MKTKFKSLLVALVFSITLLPAAEMGTITLFSFHNEIPLPGNEVRIDSKDVYKTDTDGSVVIFAEVGVHQIEIFGKSNDGKNLGFFKKPVIVKEDQDTQLIATFNDEQNPNVKIDTPLDSANKQADLESAIKGRLNGVILSSDLKKAITNARVFVKGTSIDARTDKDGKFSVLIPADTNVSISVVHSEYSSQTINNLQVKENQIIARSIELTPASMELEEFVVLAPKVEGSLTALTAEVKEASAIANIVGSEQMSKKGDSNAAAALKRISGVTIVDGKDVYIRGLGERYSNIELNSMPIPSPNPYKRTIPLNMFPASVIGSMKVQKTYSSDITGNFAGGYIDLRTKESVKKDFLKITIGAKAHSSALSGDKGYYYNGGSTDFLGVDDGTRAIPNSILNSTKVIVGENPPTISPFNGKMTQEQIVSMTKDLAKREINTNQEKIPFGGKVRVEFGKKFEVDGNSDITLIANYTYDQSHKRIVEEFHKYPMNGYGELDPTEEQYGTNDKTYSKYKQNALLSLGYNLGDAFHVKYTSLYVLETDEKTRVTEGIIGSDLNQQKFYALDWQEKTIFANQINGSMNHKIYVPLKLDFGMQYATANLYQPGNVGYTYVDPTKTGNAYELITVSTTNLNYQKINTDDNVFSIYMNESADINLLDSRDKIDIGFAFTNKTRSNQTNMYYLYGQNPSDITKEDQQQDPDFIKNKYITQQNNSYYDSTYLVQPIFAPSDYYDADLIDAGFYLKTILNPLSNLEIGMGVRQAMVTQTLHEYVTNPSDGTVMIRDNEISINKPLPSIDAKYMFTKDDQLRFGFSQTYVYPDFREFSSGGFQNPDEIGTIVGNPDLTYTDVTNVDLRYEHYFSDSESWSIAGYFKYLLNPIEDVSKPTTSLPVYSYQNSNDATLFGIELDASKNLDFIDSSLNRWLISGNFTYTDSVVTLKEDQIDGFTTNNRQLQGLSPIVLNASIGYSNKKGRNLNISYNYMSERIRKVGLKNGAIEEQDQYEQPPHIVDFTYSEKLYNNMTLKFKARNLLNNEITWRESDNITKRYKLGTTYELEASIKY